MIKKKTHSSKGFTLTELLVAIVILSLTISSIAICISSSLRVYKSTTNASELQILSSTLAQSIMEELRYSREVTTDAGGELSSFTSSSRGSNVSFGIADEGDDEGVITLGGSHLVTSGAYSNGIIKARNLHIIYNEGTNSFNVSFELYSSTEGQQDVEFSVLRLNQD